MWKNPGVCAKSNFHPFLVRPGCGGLNLWANFKGFDTYHFRKKSGRISGWTKL